MFVLLPQDEAILSALGLFFYAESISAGICKVLHILCLLHVYLLNVSACYWLCFSPSDLDLFSPFYDPQFHSADFPLKSAEKM